MIEPDTDEEAALDPVTDADSDILFVLEPDSDLEVLAVTDGLLLSVGSAVVDADTLLLTVVVAVVVASIDSEAVVDGVKLGETGLFVTEGVGVGVGINSVYDTKNADPLDAIFTMSAPICVPLPS